MSEPADRSRHLDPRLAIPGSVRLAGWIASVQGVLGVGVAVALVVRAVAGHREETVVISAYGTAAWFAILFGGLLAAGIGLLRGRRGGRGLVVIAEFLMLLVSVWAVAMGSHRYLLGLVLAAVCVTAIGALFRRDAVAWYAE